MESRSFGLLNKFRIGVEAGLVRSSQVAQQTGQGAHLESLLSAARIRHNKLFEETMSKKKKRLNPVCSDEQYARYQEQCRESGIKLRSTDRLHWLFDDAESGRRLMNYFYRTGTCCGLDGKGFRVCDIQEAIKLVRGLKGISSRPKEKAKPTPPPKTPRTTWPNYQKYQQSAVWKAKREAAFAVHGRECKRCGSDFNLHVIRLTYEKPYGQEDPATDLEIRCAECRREDRNPGPDGVTRQYLKMVRDLKPSPSAPSPA